MRNSFEGLYIRSILKVPTIQSRICVKAEPPKAEVAGAADEAACMVIRDLFTRCLTQLNDMALSPMVMKKGGHRALNVFVIKRPSYPPSVPMLLI